MTKKTKPLPASMLPATMPKTPPGWLTVGQIAKRFGVDMWQVQKLFERGLLPTPQKIGVYRVLPEAAMPAVEKALREWGYLK